MSPPTLRLIRGYGTNPAPASSRCTGHWSRGDGNLVYLIAPPAEDFWEEGPDKRADLAGFLRGGVFDELVARRLALMERMRRDQD